MNHRAIIDDIVVTCAHELFAQYDTALEPVASPLDPHEYVAVIAFYGDSIRGSLGIGLDRDLVARMLPGEATSDHRIIEDCTGETANQLLGRVKNKLLGYGVALGIALPIVLRGVEVQVLNAKAEVWPYRFATAGGGLTVWFDGHIDPNIELAQQADGESLASCEGELTMF